MNKSQIRKIKRRRGIQQESSIQNTYRNNDIRAEYKFIASSYSSDKFYKTKEWKQLRYRALKDMGNVCMLCGASPKFGAIIHVDHVKPRSIYPELAFDISNLQILCKDCNEGKSNTDQTNWKRRQIPNSITVSRTVVRRPKYAIPVEDDSTDFVLEYLQKDKVSNS